MNRRSRSGRERSRDQSRLFSQVRARDRDRDYDSRYRWEERQHREEELDRRAEERRRDDRPHPPTVLSQPPPLPVVESSSFVRDASNARRESRDSTRDIPPVATTRRHSGGSSSVPLRKEYSEPSPRERGMIDPPRRQISGSSWPRDRDRDRDRDDERARSDTVRSRKNSLERNPGLSSRSPIVESPRSFVHPTSPATSTTAAPSTSMAPSAPLSSTANHPISATENKDATRVFLEASYAYAKYLKAESNLKVAEKERNDHAEHFNAFPALKDRYEGNLKAARKEHQSATEAFNKRSAYLDRLCTKLLEERISRRDAESAIEFCDKIKKELGNSSSLTHFVKSNTPAPVPAPSKDEFQQLRNDFQEMKRKQEEEEKTRQTLENEFRNYKTEQATRLNTQDAKLSRYGTVQEELKADIGRMKDEQRKTSEELKKAMALLVTTKNSVDKLEDSGNQKSGGDAVMGDVVNEEVLSGVRKSLESLQKDVVTNQNNIRETNTRFKKVEDTMTLVKNEAETFRQMTSKLGALGIAQNNGLGEALPGGPGAVSHENCATKADIERLAGDIKSQDKIIDEFRTGAEKDTNEILEEIQTLDQGIGEKIQTLDQNIGEKIQTLEQKTNWQIAALLTQQDGTKIKDEIKGINEKFEQHFGNFHNKFISEVERVDQKVAFVENQLESHVLAITHQEQRMNNFTTKDFYDRVVQSLVQMNPLVFDYANQLQHCSNEIKTVKEGIRALTTRLAAVAQSPHPAVQDRSSIDASSNGAVTKSDRSSEGPSPSIHDITRKLEMHTNEIKKLDQRIADHIETYMAKMNDIKEWTVSATQRLAENTGSVSSAMDEIKELRMFINTIYQGSGSPQIPPATATTDRWRAVGSNPEAMQGLPNENGTG